MWALIIDLLWFLIFVIILAGVVWLVLYGVEHIAGIAIPERVKQAVWFILLVLVLIFLITVIAGGGAGVRGPSFWPWKHAAAGWSGLLAYAQHHGAGALM